MNAPVAGFVAGFVILLVVEPPQLSLLHAHLFAAAHQHASRGTVQHEVEAVAEKIIRPFVDMAKDLRFGLEAHDRGARQLAVHFLGELRHEGQSSWKNLRYGGEAALLVFVDVQIGPVNGGAQENRVGIPLDPDFILAAGIDQPSLSRERTSSSKGATSIPERMSLKYFMRRSRSPAVQFAGAGGYRRGRTAVTSISTRPQGCTRAATWTVARTGLLGCSGVPKNRS